MSYAGISLVAPGVTAGTVSTAQVPFKISYSLPQIYKFVFGGIQAKGDTLGAPGNSGTNGNGGQFHLSASVTKDNVTYKEGKITFRDVQEFNSAPLKTILTDPVGVFKATTTPISVSVEWKGEGNAHKPNGWFAILGEHQKAPPVPVGSLHFDIGNYLLIQAGTTPQGVATITRD